MMTLPCPSLSPEGARVMRDALAETPHEPEHELSGALRMHERVRRWWQGLRVSLSRGVEGSQVRAMLHVQITFCEADAIFLQVALDNAAAPDPEEVERAKAALAEAREIEAKAREWLSFASQPSAPPSPEQLALASAAYERGETEDLKNVVARLRAKCSS